MIKTRKEEISNAKMVFYENMLQEDTYYGPRDCFEEGAEWADENPKSPWISVKESLPYDNPNNIHFGFTNRVFTTNGKDIFIVYMKKDKDDKWTWCSDYNITYWMPFPKLPK